jgi:protease-4|tara:strand:- start:3743 stop:4723 length:981 start_codon:yes stop_codon:yes gene_type:complete
MFGSSQKTDSFTVPANDYEKMVKDLAFFAVNEQRRRRRWRIFFTILFFVYLTPPLYLLIESSGVTGPSDSISNGSDNHTALVSLEGVISANDKSSASNIIAGLEAAFKNPNTAAVILEINSPGGSPVQSAYIYDEIIRLKQAHQLIPIYAVVSDIAASGGYFVAAATDNIYVNKSSLVGSIGVRMDNFGFVELMKKIGVERRLLTAGENKGLLDPFLPEDNSQKTHLQEMLNEVHQHFITAVKNGRGERLTEKEGLFSGLIWTGEKAIKLGLVDDYGTTKSVSRDIVKVEKVVDFTPQGEFFDRIAERIGTAASQQIQSYFNAKIN